MTVDELKNAALASSPAAFVQAGLFDRVPHIFGQDRSLFVSWKHRLAALIEVDAACIAIVGSAAVGFSLNPWKALKPFSDHSDIDVAVISSHHFLTGWRYLRMNGVRRLKVDANTRRAWDMHVDNYIYWGTLATDYLLGVMPFGSEWLKAASVMAGIAPTQGRMVNFRIYNDYDSLRQYQVKSIRSLQEAQAEGADSAKVS